MRIVEISLGLGNIHTTDIMVLIDHMDIELFEKINNKDMIDFFHKRISEFRKEDIFDYIMSNYSPKYSYEKEINYISVNNIYCIITFYDIDGNKDEYYVFEGKQSLYPNGTIIDIVRMRREINLNKILYD